MPEDLQMKAEDLLMQLPSRAAIPQIWTSVAWLDHFKDLSRKGHALNLHFLWH
jgi:hypothetical protein